MSGVHLYGRRAPTPTAETIARIEELLAGFDAHADDAELREEDVTWWERNTPSLLRDMRRARQLADMSDAEVADDLRTHQPERVAKEVADRYISRSPAQAMADLVAKERRNADVWTTWIAGFLVAFPRIEAEGLRLTKRAQRARAALHGFVGAIAVTAGTHAIARSCDDEDEAAP